MVVCFFISIVRLFPVIMPVQGIASRMGMVLCRNVCSCWVIVMFRVNIDLINIHWLSVAIGMSDMLIVYRLRMVTAAVGVCKIA